MIGIFDSGVGGLSVWLEIIKLLPNEPIIYFGDSSYCPYGRKSKEEIINRSSKITEFLISQGVDIITVACNTVTAAAIEYLRASYDIPFVGMEPAIKPAILNSKTGVVGVLATKGTLSGELYLRTLHKFAADTIVLERPGDGLVELVEEGKLDTHDGDLLISKYITPMIEQNADHIVLGCTHYPFLINAITKIAGPNIKIINPAPAVAKRSSQILSELKKDKKHQSSTHSLPYKYMFYTTGDNSKVIEMIVSNKVDNNYIIKDNFVL
jgi:glutamate racemase